MAKKPEERYPTCAEVVQDLRLLARGQAPEFARHRLDHAVFDTLASGEVVDERPVVAAAGSGPSPLVVGLSVALAISVLIILLLLAR